MLRWLKQRLGNSELPEYTRLRETPTRQLPARVGDAGLSEMFDTRRAEIRAQLWEHRPQADDPLFVGLASKDRTGFVTLPIEGKMSLLVFTSPHRAADYRRDPKRLLEDFPDMIASGIEYFTLDRCPRCAVVLACGMASYATADDVIDQWAIQQSTELARAELYTSAALAYARDGDYDLARDLALETIGHVRLEDPRAHLLLGAVAVATRDKVLLREARQFLQFFGHQQWEAELDKAVTSGRPNFGA